jgi:prepilin peptidase CpaA
MHTSLLLLVVFPALMAFAAFSDLLTFTISNRVSIILVLGYVASAIFLRLPLEQVGLDLLCGLTVFALSLTLFSFNQIGGGDAKLATSTALWLGWSNLLSYGLVASLAGGALTLFIVFLRFHDLPKWLLSIDFVARLADKESGVPYGVALAFGGLVVYPHTLIWSRLAGL